MQKISGQHNWKRRGMAGMEGRAAVVGGVGAVDPLSNSLGHGHM